VPLNLEGLSSDAAEERRLLYVAITRAKRLVVISHAGRRTLFGQTLDGGQSPFLIDLPSAAVTRTSPELPKKKRDSQLSLF
jgi:DNA helicase-2/ATP-dependent DNA helicase PcrA